MIQENLRVTAQTVLSQMLEGHKTFGDLAPKYGMTEEQFKKIVEKVVNDKDYPRLLKVNDKYITARNRIGKHKISTVDQGEEKEKTKNNEQQDITTLRKDMANELSSIEEQIAKKSIEKERCEKSRLLANAELAEAQEKLKIAEDAVKKAENSWKKISGELDGLINTKKEIMEKIEEIDSKVIYLVAPNYKGEKPEFGTLISVIPMDGAKVEDVSEVMMLTELSSEDMFLFESMEEAKAVYQYIKLVTMYFVEDKDYKLLIDSEAVIKLLKKQELIDV